MYNKRLFFDLVIEYGRPITVRTAEEWSKVETYGNYEMKYENGELWSYNGKLYYLDPIQKGDFNNEY